MTNLNTVELKSLLKDFYILTKIKIVIFDIDYNELLAYPESHCSFCSILQNNTVALEKCQKSNIQSFEHCKKISKMHVYHCHAGLIEATAPLIDNGLTIGYIMFGQITDIHDDKILQSLLNKALEDNNIVPTNSKELFLQIERKTSEQIHAAAKIMEACTFYALLKDLVSVRRQNFMENLNNYLHSNLADDLSVEQIARDFGISRSKLYATCEKYLGIGLAQHIKLLRLEKSKLLLRETNLSISQISSEVGFSDYNYFCRVFKQEVGMPANKYRNINQ